MKTCIATATLFIFSSMAGLAEPPAASPEILKPQFAILNTTYPNVDAKKFPKAPADSVWLFRSSTSAAGTLEVAFQGDVVVYMIFRRGTGGSGWKPAEAEALHRLYSKTLLKEPPRGFGTKYNHAVLTQINAATITRKDFDAKALVSGS
jgi:hypothetical protein